MKRDEHPPAFPQMDWPPSEVCEVCRHDGASKLMCIKACPHQPRPETRGDDMQSPSTPEVQG